MANWIWIVGAFIIGLGTGLVAGFSGSFKYGETEYRRGLRDGADDYP
jgi:hypothetical protein